MCQSVCPFVHLSVHLSISLSVCLSVCPFVCRSVHLSEHLSVLHVCLLHSVLLYSILFCSGLSVHHSIFFGLSFCLCLCLFVHLLNPSICLLVRVSVCNVFFIYCSKSNKTSCLRTRALFLRLLHKQERSWKWSWKWKNSTLRLT